VTWKASDIMSQEPPNPALERLTEETAEALIFTIGATPGDPKQAVMQLLLSYLQRAHEQLGQAGPYGPSQERPSQKH
jgi:hypothetical protein